MVGRKEGAKKKFQFDNGTQLRATETAEKKRGWLEEEEKGSKKRNTVEKRRGGEGRRKSALN